jgi:hypothetical protein
MIAKTFSFCFAITFAVFFACPAILEDHLTGANSVVSYYLNNRIKLQFNL